MILAYAATAWDPFAKAAANHLWQSTLFALVAGLLALALRKNHARTRCWLWMAASVKFLVPFWLFIAVGAHFGQSLAPAAPAARLPVVIEQIGQPFAVMDSLPNKPAVVAAARPTRWLPGILLAVWFCGSVLSRPLRWQTGVRARP